jgi:hypothetical protein
MVELMAMAGSEGRRYSPQPSSEVRRGRRETLPLEERPLVTGLVAVDYSRTNKDGGAKFREDAFRLEKTDSGHLLVMSFVDASFLVPKNSTQDANARKNGDRAARPMFANDLRNEMCFKSGEERASITLTIPIDKNYAHGNPQVQLTRTRLELGGELSHEDAWGILQDPRHEMYALFSESANVAINLRNRRRMDDSVGPRDLTSYKDHALTPLIVEEFKLLANSAVTLFLIENEIPAIFQGNFKEIPEGNFDPYFYTHLHRILESPYADVSLGIREYESVVSQRNLAAFLVGGPPAHDGGELNEISYKLNERTLSPDEMKAVYGEGRIPQEVNKVTTKQRGKDIHDMKKLQRELKEEHGNGIDRLRERTIQKRKAGATLEEDEEKMRELMQMKRKLNQPPEKRTVYVPVKHVAPGGERIPANGKERNGKRATKPKEVFPGKQKKGPCIVSISKLNLLKGSQVTIETLIKQKFVDERAREVGVAIHAIGNLNSGKSLDVVGISVTDSAIAKILARKGTVQDIPLSKAEVMRKDAQRMKQLEAIERRNDIYSDVNRHGKGYGPSELPFWQILRDERKNGIYPYGEMYGPSQIPESVMENYYLKRDTSGTSAVAEKVKIPKVRDKSKLSATRRKERTTVRGIRRKEKENGIYRKGAWYEVRAHGPSELGFWDLLNEERRKGIKPGKPPSKIAPSVMEEYYAPRIDLLKNVDNFSLSSVVFYKDR